MTISGGELEDVPISHYLRSSPNKGMSKGSKGVGKRGPRSKKKAGSGGRGRGKGQMPRLEAEKCTLKAVSEIINPNHQDRKGGNHKDQT